MNTKIAILSSLVCLFGTNVARASDCIGTGCDIEQMATRQVTVSEPRQLGIIQTPIAEYSQPVEYFYADQIPMRQVKMLSVKPVAPDNRAPVWDGTHEKYQSRGYDKTVDWRDGVPIWDDSIVSYRDKDFSDWFLEPLPEIYEQDIQATPDIAVQMYNQNMNDAIATRARIEELLTPQRPQDNLWTNNTVAPRATYTAQDMTETVQTVFGRSDGCPFDTDAECDIWRRKY